MSVPRYLNRVRWSRHLVHKVVSSLILATLLAGLIPPPAFSRVLPAPVAELAEALLPQVPAALAQGGIPSVTEIKKISRRWHG